MKNTAKAKIGGCSLVWKKIPQKQKTVVVPLSMETPKVKNGGCSFMGPMRKYCGRGLSERNRRWYHGTPIAK